MASEKMRYTLELKEKRVKESELEARADMVQRELQAEAAGKVQVIAAKAQEEAMKHVLPFKQRQVEQRKLEAEADKQSRIRTAEGNAEARRIEADGEALARQRLAQAEAFRLEAVGKANAEQMAREGSLLSRHPLLIQKVMADKLSDKVQVIIAAPGADGGFIGSGLLGHPGKAVALAEGAVYAGNPEQYRTELAWYANATPADVQAAAREWLTSSAYVQTVLPGTRPAADNPPLPAHVPPPRPGVPRMGCCVCGGS